MAIHEEIKLFEQNEVRSAWDDEKEQWFFSVTDVVAILTDSADPKQYIKKLRARDPELDFSWGYNLYPNSNEGGRWKDV